MRARMRVRKMAVRRPHRAGRLRDVPYRVLTTRPTTSRRHRSFTWANPWPSTRTVVRARQVRLEDVNTSTSNYQSPVVPRACVVRSKAHAIPGRIRSCCVLEPVTSPRQQTRISLRPRAGMVHAPASTLNQQIPSARQAVGDPARSPSTHRRSSILYKDARRSFGPFRNTPQTTLDGPRRWFRAVPRRVESRALKRQPPRVFRRFQPTNQAGVTAFVMTTPACTRARLRSTPTSASRSLRTATTSTRASAPSVHARHRGAVVMASCACMRTVLAAQTNSSRKV